MTSLTKVCEIVQVCDIVVVDLGVILALLLDLERGARRPGVIIKQPLHQARDLPCGNGGGIKGNGTPNPKGKGTPNPRDGGDRR